MWDLPSLGVHNFWVLSWAIRFSQLGSSLLSFELLCEIFLVCEFSSLRIHNCWVWAWAESWPFSPRNYLEFNPATHISTQSSNSDIISLVAAFWHTSHHETQIAYSRGSGFAFALEALQIDNYRLPHEHHKSEEQLDSLSTKRKMQRKLRRNVT